jgi:hypothetical protein
MNRKGIPFNPLILPSRKKNRWKSRNSKARYANEYSKMLQDYFGIDIQEERKMT